MKAYQNMIAFYIRLVSQQDRSLLEGCQRKLETMLDAKEQP